MYRPKTKLLVAVGILVAAGAYLAYAGIKSGQSYYRPVDEFLAQPGSKNQRIRVVGTVAKQDLQVHADRRLAQFQLLGKTSHLPVMYHGLLPEMFEAGKEVVVDGQLGPDGVFEARTIMTKCASKYQSKESGRVVERPL